MINLKAQAYYRKCIGEKKDRIRSVFVVPGAGLEPARLAAGDFESPASTNFTTRATKNKL